MVVILFPDLKFVLVVFEVWISGIVESGPGDGPGGQPGERPT